MNLNTDWVNEKIPIHSSYMDLWSSSYGVLWSLLDPSRIRNPAIYGLPFGCVAFKTAMKCPATLVRCPSTGPWHYEVISFNPRPRGLSPCDSQAGYIYIYIPSSQKAFLSVTPAKIWMMYAPVQKIRPIQKSTPFHVFLLFGVIGQFPLFSIWGIHGPINCHRLLLGRPGPSIMALAKDM